MSRTRKTPTAAVVTYVGRMEASSKLIERGSFVTVQSLRIIYCWKAPLLGFFDAKTSAKPVTLSPFLKWVTPEPAASTVPAMSLPRMVGYDSMK